LSLVRVHDTRSTANNISDDHMVTSSMHTNLSNFDHFGGAGIYEIGSLTFA